MLLGSVLRSLRLVLDRSYSLSVLQMVEPLSIIAIHGMRVFDTTTTHPTGMGPWDYADDLVDDLASPKNGGDGRDYIMRNGFHLRESTAVTPK